jgi:hypothetical protein
MSQVFDHFDPLIPNGPSNPWVTPATPAPSVPWFTPVVPSMPPAQDPEAVKRILEEFAKAREAAAIVDKALGNKDCVDPEKAKLLDRIVWLEKIIDALLAAKKQ